MRSVPAHSCAGPREQARFPNVPPAATPPACARAFRFRLARARARPLVSAPSHRGQSPWMTQAAERILPQPRALRPSGRSQYRE